MSYSSLKHFAVRILPVILLLIGVQGTMTAENAQSRKESPHEVRFGIGDCLFETLAFHSSPNRSYSDIGGEITFSQNGDYHYLPHFYVEYQYRVGKWFGVGIRTDYSHFGWKKYYYRAGSDANAGVEKQGCFNFSFVPNMRFTWLNKNHFSFYSGIGFGIDINGGTEKNIHGRDTGIAPELELTTLGFTVNWGKKFGAIEVGGINSLKNANCIYLLGSRLVSVSYGVRF